MILTDMELLKRIANMKGGPEYDGARELAREATARWEQARKTFADAKVVREMAENANKDAERTFGVSKRDFFLEKAAEQSGHGSKFAGKSPTIGYKVYAPSQEV